MQTIDGNSLKQILSSEKMAKLPDKRKQDIMNDVMVAKRTALEVQIQLEGGSEATDVAKPDYAFETIQSNGVFSIFFDKGLTGLDFIAELDVDIKARGTISGQYADELD